MITTSLQKRRRPLLFLFSLAILLPSIKCTPVQVQEPPKGPPQPFPYALSTTYLMFLARTEVEIYKEMKQYAHTLRERLGLVQAYLQDYEDSSGRATAHLPETMDSWARATQIAAHPIASYRMIRRFAVEFDAIGHHNNNGEVEKGLHERIGKLSSAFAWPSTNDLKDAMDAMLRIHYVYNLNIEQFAKGNIMGVQTEVGFPALQMYQIADYAAKIEHYSLAMDWLRATELRLLEQNKTSNGRPSPVTLDNVDSLYSAVVAKHDQNFERNKNVSQLYMFTERLSEHPDAPTLRQVKYESIRGLNKSGLPSDTVSHYTALALCNGEDFQTPRMKAKLRCWYDRRNPYFYLFPLKAELLNRNPLLIQFHDIVSEPWTKEMKIAAIPTLQRAPQNVPGATPRTATYAWLLDEHIPRAPISRRIELITGLNVRGRVASEDLQIASYAYGGHVSQHVDSLNGNPEKDPVLKLKGDRVTTFLVYLNDVQKGGYTAFPRLGAHVKPTKGSAVLWYTALKNGQIDTRMIHAACPIVLGHKWIATKWTHLNKNFLTRPCGLRAEQ